MAERESQRDYLHRQIAERLARLESSIKWYRQMHFYGHMATVLLSLMITVIAGMKSLWKVGPQASDVVLVLGALVTVASTWAAFFSPKESWHLNARTYSRLRGLQAQLEFSELAPKFDHSVSTTFSDGFSEYQKILDSHNEQWQNVRLKSK